MRTPSARTVARLLQAGVGAVLVAGVVTRNVSVVVNAVLGLAVTFLPALLRRDYRLHLSPGVSLWVALAVFLHTLGMAGPYHSVWWWDNLTHATSAALVAGVSYATVAALDEHRPNLDLPQPFLVVFILLSTIAFGVLWEVLEFATRGAAHALDLDPVLVQYGVTDSLLDLVFDAVGAVVVAVFGARHLRRDVSALTAWLEFESGQ
ncbi:hypothetical protein [Halobacterium zhouii]|uniref:hypothetical protein n=1 Tax=Halobacterium zhouii TaxID=2902624 RepID=UPI001E532468|nr:hypothetical protein [Halobacterium zhouii]